MIKIQQQNTMLRLMPSFFLGVFCVLFWGNVQAGSPVDTWLADTSPKLSAKPANVQWKFAHPAPPVSLLPPIWQAGFDWFEQVSEGAIQFKMYGGGALYGATGGFKAIRAGIADAGTCYTVAEAKGFELLKTFQLPYVSPENPYLTARIINELAATTLKDEFTRRGVYPAHIFPLRPLTLMSKEAIRTPEDLRGKKVVSYMNTPGAADALGYSEVRLPFTEIYTALQQGVVDAVIWIDMGFIPFKIYEQAKFYTVLNIAPATIDTCLNRKSFDRLDKPVKQLMYDFQQKVGISIVEKAEQFSQKAQGILQSNGVEVIHLNSQQTQQWQKAMAPVRSLWMDDCEKAGKDCRALVSEIDRLKEKYSKLSNDELIRLAIEEPVQGIIEF